MKSKHPDLESYYPKMPFHQFGFYLVSHYNQNPVLAAFTIQDEIDFARKTLGTKYQQLPSKPRADFLQRYDAKCNFAQ